MASTDLTFMLEQAQRRLSHELDHALSSVGASAAQWRVLDMLSDEGGRPIGELAQQLSMNPPTMTKLIDRMVASGLVQRKVDDEDNRRVLVFVTDVGLQLFEKLAERATEFHAGLTQTLNSRDASQLKKLLSHLSQRIN